MSEPRHCSGCGTIEAAPIVTFKTKVDPRNRHGLASTIAEVKPFNASCRLAVMKDWCGMGDRLFCQECWDKAYNLNKARPGLVPNGPKHRPLPVPKAQVPLLPPPTNPEEAA